MKVAGYVKKVKESEVFKDLVKEDPKVYLCSLFFTKDVIENRNEVQVDFYSPKSNFIVNFKVNKTVERVPLTKKPETLTHKKIIPKELKDSIKMDFEEIEPSIVDEMHNRGMTYQVEKVLAFVNITDGEVIWNCTAFLRGLGLLIVHIEDKTKSVLYMEKKSFLDIFRFVGGTGTKPQEVVEGKQDLGKSLAKAFEDAKKEEEKSSKKK